MSSPVGIDLSSGDNGLGVLAIRGADAAGFLQGQLSADVEALVPGASTLAGFHNPQGRVIALLAIVRVAADEFFAVLPRELAAGVTQRLGKYVLRARVRMADESSSWRVFGAFGGDTAGPVPPISWGARQLLIVAAPGEPGESDAIARAAWERADIAAGLPQVYSSTSESFVAQMLNLDLLGAIAFDKGCYTGQEVIARAHYRGRVKRRMQRWHNLTGVMLEAGQAAHSADGRQLVIVRVAREGAIAQDLLAVGNFAESPDHPEGAPADGPRVTGPLTLPYSLPA